MNTYSLKEYLSYKIKYNAIPFCIRIENRYRGFIVNIYQIQERADVRGVCGVPHLSLLQMPSVVFWLFGKVSIMTMACR